MYNLLIQDPVHLLNRMRPLRKSKKSIDKHALQTKIFREYTLVDKILKQLLLDAVEDKYYRVKCNSLIGYTNVTNRYLIQYLYQAYSNITSTQVSDNDKKLRTPYEPCQHIESLYEQIDNAIAFTEAADDGHTGNQIVAIANEIIFQTGIYAGDCKLWRKKAKADKIWPEFNFLPLLQVRTYGRARPLPALRDTIKHLQTQLTSLGP